MALGFKKYTRAFYRMDRNVECQLLRGPPSHLSVNGRPVLSVSGRRFLSMKALSPVLFSLACFGLLSNTVVIIKVILCFTLKC